MRAWWYDKPGPTDVMTFGELPDPVPGDGEVRVRVAYSMINPTDAKRRETGRELELLGRITPNNDGSGIIDRVGPGVSEDRIGERVWIFGAQSRRAMGTAAEFTLLPSHQAILLPDNASLKDGACLGVPAVTAHCGLFTDGPLSGKSVMISGASGRVGAYGVQFAKWAGAATVIGTAGAPEKVEYVRSLGADHALSYKSDDIVARVLEITAGKGVDHILDVAFGRTIQMAARIMAANGVMTDYANDGGDPSPVVPNFRDIMQKCITLRPYGIYSLPQARRDHAFRDITTCLAAGTLSHRIVGPMAFEGMRLAHDAVENGEIFGCLLVEVDGSLD